jgi:hypothetical protein
MTRNASTSQSSTELRPAAPRRTIGGRRQVLQRLQVQHDQLRQAGQAATRAVAANQAELLDLSA